MKVGDESGGVAGWIRLTYCTSTYTAIPYHKVEPEVILPSWLAPLSPCFAPGCSAFLDLVLQCCQANMKLYARFLQSKARDEVASIAFRVCSIYCQKGDMFFYAWNIVQMLEVTSLCPGADDT